MTRNTPNVESRVVGAVRFLCEQDGHPERALKEKLIPLLQKDRIVRRAYLAQVDYGEPSEPSVALCLSARESRESLVREVGAIFSGMFGSQQCLDTMFVNRDQERRLSLICSPFFEDLMSEPDFYLASSEGYDLEQPRRCWRVKHLKGDHWDDFLLVRIDPPLIGQQYGLGANDLDHVIVAARHNGASLFPIQKWPAFVHVARALVPLEGRDRIGSDEIESIGWAALYETEQQASSKAL